MGIEFTYRSICRFCVSEIVKLRSKVCECFEDTNQFTPEEQHFGEAEGLKELPALDEFVGVTFRSFRIEGVVGEFAQAGMMELLKRSGSLTDCGAGVSIRSYIAHVSEHARVKQRRGSTKNDSIMVQVTPTGKHLGYLGRSPVMKSDRGHAISVFERLAQFGSLPIAIRSDGENYFVEPSEPGIDLKTTSKGFLGPALFTPRWVTSYCRVV